MTDAAPKTLKFLPGLMDAILLGAKTQTRRPVDTYAVSAVRRVLGPLRGGEFDFIFPDPGDSQKDGIGHVVDCPWGKAGDAVCLTDGPRSISAIIKKVRVEKLQDISEADAKAEGVLPTDKLPTYKSSFYSLWDSLCKPGMTAFCDPWVWVIEWEVMK